MTESYKGIPFCGKLEIGIVGRFDMENNREDALKWYTNILDIIPYDDGDKFLIIYTD